MINPSDKILAIDIGGSHIKSTMLDYQGNILVVYKSMVTPKSATPENVLKTIKSLTSSFDGYNLISVGFPGYVRDGIVFTAPNLSPKDWNKIPLAQMIENELGKPARVVNDADMQGLGVAEGKGLEMVLTLGTGFGTALLRDGVLMPHIELAHHPVSKNKTYDEYVGEKAYKTCGKKKWNKRMKKIIPLLKSIFNYDMLYIGGGNASKINFELSTDITIVTNKDGIHGGARLWY